MPRGTKRRSDWAWIALALGVLLYDFTAPDGETLSEACDRYLERRPTLTRVAIMVVAHHLLNDVDPRLDPIARLFGAVKGLPRLNVEARNVPVRVVGVIQRKPLRLQHHLDDPVHPVNLVAPTGNGR